MDVKQSMETWRETLEKKLHEKNWLTDQLALAEQKTGVKRIYFAAGAVALIGLYLMVGYGSQILCNFIGFLYPAYASVKAIESVAKDDDTQWLIYWVVYSVFALSELVTDIFFFWLPFYWFFKCLFLVWCMAPTSWNGSVMIYEKAIRPFVLKYETRIDTALHKAQGVAGDILNEGTKMGQAAADAAVKEGVDSYLSSGTSSGTKED